MKGYLFITVVLAVSVFAVFWTIWYLFGHLTGRVGHLTGKKRSAYQLQMQGYKAERRGDLQEAVDAYGESLRVDPTNHELEDRRARLMVVLEAQDKNG